jgi:hypothetical protein
MILVRCSLFICCNKLKLSTFLSQEYMEQLFIIELLITQFYQSVRIVHVGISEINPLSYRQLYFSMKDASEMEGSSFDAITPIRS